ncbi:MAG: phosphoribosyl-ATP pyrophosphatase [Bacteroidetes bacterium]|nr:phosphoribosyl-ATP pyrophosphatase [Bacteroidota bacterium]
MSTKYNSLEELRRKKELLKSEVQDLESLISFDNAKDSLSAFTNGFSDKFIAETVDENGHAGITLKKEEIMKEVASEVKDRVIGKNKLLNLASTASKNGFVEEAVKLGITVMISGYAKKNLKNSNWKKRIIGLAMVYIAPMFIRYSLKKLESYQKNKSISSFEKLI